MKIADDKRKHLLGGLGCLLFCLLGFWVQHRFGLVVAVLFAGVGVSAGMEVYQAVRKEGQPDPVDALFTMVPFGLAAALLHFTQWRPWA